MDILKRFIWCSVSILFCFFTLLSAAQKKVDIAGTEETLYPFTLEQENPFFNWTIDNKNFSGIEIFAMGEATHGTKEFFEIKAATFKYLVTHNNFRNFGLETSFGECCYINDFVQSGDGNIDSLMSGLSFWCWKSQEVRSLILWMRDFNTNLPDSLKISVFGFDMQDVHAPLAYFYHVLTANALGETAKINELLSPVLSKTQAQTYRAIGNIESNYSDTLKYMKDAIAIWWRNNLSLLNVSLSTEEIENLSFCIDNFKQAVNNFCDSASIKNISFRDSCMAVNIERMQQRENSKMFIWAHNGHVGLSPPPRDIRKPMGYFLNQVFREKYYSVGFVFDRGLFNAYEYVKISKKEQRKDKNKYTGSHYQYRLVNCSLPHNQQNTLTNVFSAFGFPALFIDISESNSPLFISVQYAYGLGAAFYGIEKSSVEIIAKAQYNGLVYVDSTNATSLITKN